MRGVLESVLVACLTLAGCAVPRTIADGFPYDAMLAASGYVAGQEGHGSGVLIAPRYILTAAHVISEQGPFTVIWGDGTETPVTVKQSWPEMDVAILELAETSKTPPALVACGATKLGENVAAVGNPLNVTNAVMLGVVMSVDEVGKRHAVALNVPAVSGMSGGGVFNLDGAVVGITDAMVMLPLEKSVFKPTGDPINVVTIVPSGISIMVPATEFCPVIKPYLGGGDA